MAFLFDGEALRQILEESGYDVVVDDVASGRREGTGRAYAIDIDRGGRVKFVRTEMEDEPEYEDKNIDGHDYRLLAERTKTVTIATELRTVEDLRAVLPNLERLSRR